MKLKKNIIKISREKNSNQPVLTRLTCHMWHEIGIKKIKPPKEGLNKKGPS
jgi:hypothetical protein